MSKLLTPGILQKKKAFYETAFPDGLLGLYGYLKLGSYEYAVRLRRKVVSGGGIDGEQKDFTASEIHNGTAYSWIGASNEGYRVTLYDQISGTNNSTISTEADQPLVFDTSGNFYGEIFKTPSTSVDEDLVTPLEVTSDNITVHIGMRIYKNGYAGSNTEGAMPFSATINKVKRPFRTALTGDGGTFERTWKDDNSYSVFNGLFDQNTTTPITYEKPKIYSIMHARTSVPQRAFGNNIMTDVSGNAINAVDGSPFSFEYFKSFNQARSLVRIESGTLVGKYAAWISGFYYGDTDIRTIGDTSSDSSIEGYLIVLNSDGSLYTGVPRYVGINQGNTSNDPNMIFWDDDKFFATSHSASDYYAPTIKTNRSTAVINVALGTLHTDVGDYNSTIDNLGGFNLSMDSNKNVFVTGMGTNGFNNYGRIRKVNADGTEDLTWHEGTGFSRYTGVTCILPDDTILVGMPVLTDYNDSGTLRFLWALNSDGTVNTTLQAAIDANTDYNQVQVNALEYNSTTGYIYMAHANILSMFDLSFNTIKTDGTGVRVTQGYNYKMIVEPTTNRIGLCGLNFGNLSFVGFNIKDFNATPPTGVGMGVYPLMGVPVREDSGSSISVSLFEGNFIWNISQCDQIHSDYPPLTKKAFLNGSEVTVSNDDTDTTTGSNAIGGMDFYFSSLHSGAQDDTSEVAYLFWALHSGDQSSVTESAHDFINDLYLKETGDNLY